ncbi:hypothetical protein N7512_005259 [Penicillium capsulatum]|nr:hypothetical protein N7512_005259 [Penicillium capsulatum]
MVPSMVRWTRVRAHPKPPIVRIRVCCEIFKENVSSGFISLGQTEDTLLASDSEHIAPHEKIKGAIGDLVLAIGAQYCVSDPGTVQIERAYFARGQQRAFANSLEDPGMDLVRAFLLMSFYMFGACRRNAAFMYLGVAARSAVALGLHEAHSGPVGYDDYAERLLWMSLCVIDLLASAILGRPAATAALHRDNRDDMHWVATTPAEHRLFASYKLSIIVQEVISRLYSGKAASADTANALLKKLNRWSERLPDSLRTPSQSGDSKAVQEHSVGNLHVACSYHFAVILVTRPFLISTLSIRLARLPRIDSTDSLNDALQEDPAISRLATACIDSAVYMLQTCLEVYHSDLLLRNMGILK